MRIRYPILLIAALFVSCTSYVATFYSVDEGKVDSDRRWDGEHIITQTKDVELSLFMTMNEVDPKLSNPKMHDSIPDTFALAFVAAPSDSFPWSIDSIAITEVSVFSEESLAFNLTPSPYSKKLSLTRWYQLFEHFTIPKNIRELRINFRFIIYTGGTAQEETLSVKLYRKDVVWTGPIRGLFH